jgi:transcriptional regulator GlxA family with amidase domain
VITTEEGIRLPVDATIYDAPKLDALIVASAYDMDWLFENEDLTAFLRSQAKTAAWLGSNCSGAFLYAHAGLLDGYRATTWAGGEKQLEREFPEIDVVFDQNVVVDRNRISSNGGIPSYQSALVMLSMMAGTGKAKTVFETIQLNRLIPWSDIEAYVPEDKT